MADDGFVLEIPEMVGIALSPERTAQAATRSWPRGTRIISADCICGRATSGSTASPRT